MKVWNKLDETIGALVLGVIAAYALHLGADGTVVGACVAGIITLLSVQSTRKKEEV